MARPHSLASTSIFALVLFGVRVVAQILVYCRYRWGKKGWAYITRPTFATAEEEAEWKDTEENDWKRWRDEFQQLTFNTW